ETGAEYTEARVDECPVEAGADPAHLGRRKSGAKTAADGLGVQSARKPAYTKQGQDSGAEGQEPSEHGLAPFRAGERLERAMESSDFDTSVTGSPFLGAFVGPSNRAGSAGHVSARAPVRPATAASRTDSRGTRLLPCTS